MTQLGKFEKYLIEEFFDDYRSGAMSQHTFTRRVAFITGKAWLQARQRCSWWAARPRRFPAVPTRCRRRRRPRRQGPAQRPRARCRGPRARCRSRRARPDSRRRPCNSPRAAPTSVAISQMARRWGRLGPAALGPPRRTGGPTPHIQDVARRCRKSRIRGSGPGPAEQGRRSAGIDADAVPGALTQAGVERHVSDFMAGFNY